MNGNIIRKKFKDRYFELFNLNEQKFIIKQWNNQFNDEQKIKG